MTVSRRQFVVLLLLTLVWGLNWPVMKLGISGTAAAPQPYPPLTFRALSLWGGLPVLGAALVWLKVPFHVPRRWWGETLRLALTNMLVWHVVVIVALQALSAGRAAILAYTMPVFSALLGGWLFGDRLTWRQGLGVAAAAVGVALLLSSEFTRLAGAPLAALALLGAAAMWALGTQLLRHSTAPLALLTLVFWMTAITAVGVALLAVVFERDAWRAPTVPVAGAIAYNAIGVFGFAHAAWFYLARSLPPVASSISVMLIPVLSTFAGALLLGEVLRWHDYAAMALMVAAIAAVLLKRT